MRESLTDLWRGSFGDRYTDRSLTAGEGRAEFWTKFIGDHRPSTVLELGCGVGLNLQHIAPLVLACAGLDINKEALKHAAERVSPWRVFEKDVTKKMTRSWTDTWDLVFACGLLIHIADKDLENVLSEMWRVSSRYVLVMEYESHERTVVPYRGQTEALIKRPYREIGSRLFGLAPAEHGYLGKKDGFDDLFWSLWRKA